MFCCLTKKSYRNQLSKTKEPRANKLSCLTFPLGSVFVTRLIRTFPSAVFLTRFQEGYLTV